MQRLVEPLRQLDVPALVLWGAHDPAVPVAQAQRQRESFVPFLARQLNGGGD